MVIKFITTQLLVVFYYLPAWICKLYGLARICGVGLLVPWEKIFDELIAEGFLVEKSNETYLRLQHTIRIVITFWTSKHQVITNYRYSGDGEMTRHIWELLKPYLTKKGIKFYDSLLLKIEGKDSVTSS